MSRIGRVFENLKTRGEKALVAYLVAGDPSLEETADLVIALEEAGADIVELGFPFSDPLADGPTIQRSAQRSLDRGTTLPLVLGLVSELRARTEIPIALMGYVNPVLTYGAERFPRDASEAGVDGLILPDLPPEEGEELFARFRKSGIDTILLAAPTSPPERVRKIAAATTGFLYYVSVTGVTGARDALPPDLADKVRRVRGLTEKPVCVGFGISGPAQAKEVGRLADGVVVGSAFVRAIESATSPGDRAGAVGRLAEALKASLRG